LCADFSVNNEWALCINRLFDSAIFIQHYEHNIIKATSILRRHIGAIIFPIEGDLTYCLKKTYCELTSYEKYSVPHIFDKEFTQFVLCELQNPESMHLSRTLFVQFMSSK